MDSLPSCLSDSFNHHTTNCFILGSDGSLARSVVQLVLQEVLLSFLQQLALRVSAAVAEELFRIAITRLRQKTSLLSTGDVEVLPAHASVALDAEARPCQLDILAEGAVPLAPVLVVQLEEGRLGHSVLVEKTDLGNVKGADQVDPVAHVGLFVNATNPRANLTMRRLYSCHARLAEPGLCAGFASSVAVQTSRLLNPIASLMRGYSTTVTLNNLVRVVAVISKAGPAHFWTFVLFRRHSICCTFSCSCPGYHHQLFSGHLRPPVQLLCL